MPIRKKSNTFNISIGLFLLYFLYLESLVKASTDCHPIKLKNGNTPSGLELTVVSESHGLMVVPYHCKDNKMASMKCKQAIVKWNYFIKNKADKYRQQVIAQRKRARETAARFGKNLDLLASQLKLTDEQKEALKTEKIRAKYYIQWIEDLIEAKKSGLGYCHEQTVNAALNLIVKHGGKYASRLEIVITEELGERIAHEFLHVKPKAESSETIEIDSTAEDINPLLKLNGTIVDPWNNNLRMSAVSARKKHPLLYASPTAHVTCIPFFITPTEKVYELPLVLRGLFYNLYRHYDFRKIACAEGKVQKVKKQRDESRFFKDKKTEKAASYSPKPRKTKREFNSGR